MFLELVTIEALEHRSTTDHDNNFLHLLGYIRDNIQSIRIVDPANSGNIISDDITASEKKAVADQAGESICKKNWGDIIW
jgi:hypothetical protein